MRQIRVLAQFVFFASEGRETPLWMLVFVPAVSRCCSALAVMVLPAMSTSQYAEQKKPRGHVAVLNAMLLSFLSAAVMLCGRYVLVLGAILEGYGLTLRRGYRSLGGMNGDIAGAAMTMGELFAAGALMLF